MPVEMRSPLPKTELPPKAKKSNAQKDWHRIETWANTLLQEHADDNSQPFGQATAEMEIKTILFKRTKNARGSDCIADWEHFQSVFATWKTAFCQQNANLAKPSTSFFSVVEADLLQQNLTAYENGDHSPNRVEMLVFYFRKLAGRNFLKQTTPSQLFPEGNTWTAAELTAIKEQLDKQFFNCIQTLKPERIPAIKEKHELLQKSKNDVLWWLADACVQNKDFSNILNIIIYYCYHINPVNPDDDAKRDQAMRTLSATYEKYNPLAGNFVAIYSKNFESCKQDEMDRKKSDQKRYQKEKIKKELQGKYEGEELEREVERRLSVFTEIYMDTPLNGAETDGDSIGSTIPSTDLSIIEQVEGIQSAYLILQAFTETVRSRKHLKSNHDDLFFTEIISERIRNDGDIAKHVRQKERLYTEVCNLDFLNFYLQQPVTSIYDSRCIPLKRLQVFYPEEQKPKYNRACGFPLEAIVYQRFISKNANNISGKRNTFKKHMEDCLKKENLQA